MRINIVNYEQALGMDAILSKYARMLERELIDLGHDVTISGKPAKADVNHHINFVSYVPSGGLDTTMITHVSGDKNHTEAEKIAMVKRQEKTAYGICMNQTIKDTLVKAGCDKKKLFVSGHAHDSLERRPKIIAMVFNIYPDGRKREDMIIKLLKSLGKNKSQYIFRIMGKGWEKVIDTMNKEKIRAQGWPQFMADPYLQILSTSDYLLYTGNEDSLAQSVIDAKQAGLRVIAPPQKDLTVELPFIGQADLNGIFEKMLDNEVKNWTWTNFAKTHEKIWKSLSK